MRGEDSSALCRMGRYLETPPRAWGRHSDKSGSVSSSGNTPTCVGKTADERHLWPHFQKHPHVRGEDDLLGGHQRADLETPPRAWGRLLRAIKNPPKRGNTPTCVGKTGRSNRRSNPLGKHPHVRGEDYCPGRMARLLRETPPRAWGRPPSAALGRLFAGNTPTCVGKTASQALWVRTGKKHPHVRGEDRLASEVAYRCRETPPRAWGRRQPSHDSGQHDGNTPTCVGKTQVPQGLVVQLRKHPHVRGEDAGRDPESKRDEETPPRAWGRRPQGQSYQALGGNTPTCVGKTAVSCSIPKPCRKHPHVRGEDRGRCQRRVSQGETPPRAWGRRGNHGQRGARRGNTPTCVGKTPSSLRFIRRA